MNFFFIDASALVKRYHNEPGSDVVNHLLDELLASAPERVAVSPLILTETISVLNRVHNEGRISARLFEQATARILLEARDMDVQVVDNRAILQSIPLIIRHNINSADAIHLHQLLNLHHLLHPLGHTLVLVAADRRLLRAAEDEGLLTLDPESATLADAADLLQEPESDEAGAD
ncbi:MAG: PIN domain-containing protein [Caldilineae bacterium]|nr:MAG: PIN domain-containing protein [Caldilineae bacterium]